MEDMPRVADPHDSPARPIAPPRAQSETPRRTCAPSPHRHWPLLGLLLLAGCVSIASGYTVGRVGHSHNLGQLPSCGLPETTGSGEGWRLDAGEEPGEQIVGLLAEEALSGGGAVRAPGVVVV